MESAVAVARIAKEVLTNWGFELSEKKCFFIGKRADVLKDIQEDLGFEIVTEGKKLLGNPVGLKKYRLEEIGKILKSQLEPLEALHKIRHLTSLAFQIIRKCINSRATYLARVAEPHRDAKYLFHLFDLYINAGLTSLTGYSSRPGVTNFWDVHHLTLIPYLRALPTDFGGLGIGLHGGFAGSYGCLRSRILTKNFLDHECSQEFKSLLYNTSDWGRVNLVESKDIRHWNFFQRPASSEENSWFACQTLRNSQQAIEVNFPRLTQVTHSQGPCSFDVVNALIDTAAFSSLPRANGIQSRILEPNSTVADDIAVVSDLRHTRDFLQDQNEQDFTWLRNMLTQLGWKDCAAWLVHSKFAKSGSIFTKITPSGFFETRKVYNSEFKENLCLRLMLPPIPLSSDQQTDTYTCACKALVHLLNDRFHCLGCTDLQGIFNVRHQKVVASLAKAMVTDKEPFIQILTSPRSESPEVTLVNPRASDDFGLLPMRDDTRTAKRADLGFYAEHTPVHYIVDVAVMAPTAPSYVAKETYR